MVTIFDLDERLDEAAIPMSCALTTHLVVNHSGWRAGQVFRTPAAAVCLDQRVDSITSFVPTLSGLRNPATRVRRLKLEGFLQSH